MTTTDDPILKLKAHLEKHKNREQAFFSIAGLAVLLTRLALRDTQVERLQKEVERLKQDVTYWNDQAMSKETHKTELRAEIERLTKERDDIHTLWLKCCSNSVALVHQHDELKAQVERLQDQVKRREEQNERLIVILGEQREALNAQVEGLINKGRD